METRNDMKETGGDKGLPARNKILALIAGCVLAIAFGLGIYNSPENRLNRQLELGQKYLEEGNYEQAIVAFNQAIEIDDRCLEAYVGGLEAYLHMDDAEGLTDFYEGALEVSRSLEGDELTANMGYVTSIYLAADKVYAGDITKILELSTEGLDTIGENDELITQLGDYPAKYLESLMKEGRYEEARDFIEKYRKYSLIVDWDGILARIEEAERLKAENDAFMKKVYDAMAAEDYETMEKLSDSDEVAAIVEQMEGESYVYFTDNSTARTGIGIYIYDDNVESEYRKPGYYFYYGGYQDGQRTGQGSTFISSSEYEELLRSGDGWTLVKSYSVFNGEWKNDAPNGHGSYSEYTENSLDAGNYTFYMYVTKTGNLIDGLWDGEIIQEQFGSEGYDYCSAPWIAQNGIPTEDKTEEVQTFFEEELFRKNSTREDVLQGRGEMVYWCANVDDWLIQYNICNRNERLGTIGYGDAYGN